MQEIIKITKMFPIDFSRPIRFRIINKVKYLMVHHVGAKNFSNTDLYRLHTSGKHKWATVGYHYYAKKTSNIFQFNDLTTVVNGCTNHNTNTVHGAFEGNFMNESTGDFVITQLETILEELKKYKIFPEIITHREKNKTLCPGDNLQKLIDDFRRQKKSKQGLIWGELEL